MNTQIHAWMFHTHLADVCDTARVHVFEHLELALIVDDERSGAGLLWLRVGHIVVTCLADASRAMFQVQQEVAGAGAACAGMWRGRGRENKEGMRVSAAGCGRWRQAGDDGRN